MNPTQTPETLGHDLSALTEDSRGQQYAVTCPPRPPLSIGGQGWDTWVRQAKPHRDRRQGNDGRPGLSDTVSMRTRHPWMSARRGRSARAAVGIR